MNELIPKAVFDRYESIEKPQTISYNLPIGDHISLFYVPNTSYDTNNFTQGVVKKLKQAHLRKYYGDDPLDATDLTDVENIIRQPTSKLRDNFKNEAAAKGSQYTDVLYHDDYMIIGLATIGNQERRRFAFFAGSNPLAHRAVPKLPRTPNTQRIVSSFNNEIRMGKPRDDIKRHNAIVDSGRYDTMYGGTMSIILKVLIFVLVILIIIVFIRAARYMQFNHTFAVNRI